MATSKIDSSSKRRRSQVDEEEEFLNKKRKVKISQSDDEMQIKRHTSPTTTRRELKKANKIRIEKERDEERRRRKKSSYSDSFEDTGDASFDEYAETNDDEFDDDDYFEDDESSTTSIIEDDDDEFDFDDSDEEFIDEANQEEIEEMLQERHAKREAQKKKEALEKKKKSKKVKVTLENVEAKLANPYEGLEGEALKAAVIQDAAEEIADNLNKEFSVKKPGQVTKPKKAKAKNREVAEVSGMSIKNAKKIKIPKSVQQSIPFANVYKDGEIELEEGVFSKTYYIEDTNFKIESQEKQEELFFLYGDLINTFGADVGVEVSIYSQTIHKSIFLNKIKMKARRDNLNKYREEMNEILSMKMDEGRNNLQKVRYITLTIIADDIKEAKMIFSRLDTEISSAIKKITNVPARPLTLEERMTMLYNIYNQGIDQPLVQESIVGGRKIKSFDITTINKMGLSVKDVIAPEQLTFNANYFTMGDKYARTLVLSDLPSYLNCDLMPDISSVPCNMITSVHFTSIRQDKALKALKNQLINIGSNVVDAQKRATKNGYSAELISPELMGAQNEARALIDDLTTRNQKLYEVTCIITHFADDIEQLDKDTSSIQTAVAKHLCRAIPLTYQQEYGFNSSLPLGTNKVSVNRMLTTESASVFIPFSVEELNNEGGFYYGLNAISKNMIIYDRTKGSNANGVILGVPGGGKSFSAKREIVSVLLGTGDEVYVIDPEREYTPLASLLGGEVIKIAVGSSSHLNPFDMDIEYGDGEGSTGDPVSLKADFIGAICEIVLGGKFGLSPIQKSIIDRCVRRLYRKYLDYMEIKKKEGVTIDTSRVPTLKDFYYLLLDQPEPEAQDLAIAMEIYATGSLDTFAYKTNVKTKSRFLVYDIKDIGSGLTELGLQVCLDNIWNKIIANKKRGKRTWFYIDEFYLLTQKETSALYLRQIWKRARKWGGVPTGITQNVEDLLSSKEGRGIINNCEMVYMLKQSPVDRQVLSEMFNISEAQQSFITNSDPGQGLLYNGKTIIPFEDKFPQNTKLYEVLTTKPGDVDINKVTAKPKK